MLRNPSIIPSHSGSRPHCVRRHSGRFVRCPTMRGMSAVNDQALRDTRFAMRLSLVFGVAMLVGKSAAYVLTGSAAILSDAAESVIHVVAVAFAAFSLWLSTRPADDKFLYGYERITFFSAGFEGAMISLAAVF